MDEIVHDVDNRKDFYGTTLVANYDDDEGHYCFLDDNGMLQGIIYDVLNVAANYLNISVLYQEPSLENKNVWGKRQIEESYIIFDKM